MRSWLWKTVEYPHTSSTAQTLAWLSLAMVLVSTVTFIVSTAEVLQGQSYDISTSCVSLFALRCLGINEMLI